MTVGIIHNDASTVPPEFSNIAFQNFQCISGRFSEVSNYAPYIIGETKRRGMSLEVHVDLLQG